MLYERGGLGLYFRVCQDGQLRGVFVPSEALDSLFRFAFLSVVLLMLSVEPKRPAHKRGVCFDDSLSVYPCLNKLAIESPHC